MTVNEIINQIAIDNGFDNITSEQSDRLKKGFECGKLSPELLNFLLFVLNGGGTSGPSCPANVPLVGENDIPSGPYYQCADIDGQGLVNELRRVEFSNVGLNIDEYTVRKESQQSQIWDSPTNTSSNPTGIVSPSYSLTASELFDLDVAQNNSFIMKPGKGGTFAGILKYSGDGWDGGSTGVSFMRVSANPAPILTATTQKVSGEVPGEIGRVQYNFPTGAEIKSGGFDDKSIPDGWFVQFWTEYAGNDGAGTNIGGVVTNTPNILTFLQAIFIRTGV